MSAFEELSRKLGLLEIATVKSYPDSAKLERNSDDITGVFYKNAFSAQLEKVHPFGGINWSDSPFSDFSILKENPPKKLRMVTDQNKKSPKFVDISPVNSWDTFIDSFRQLRNNLAHGAKFLDSMGLDKRDNELIAAGLSFINFLESESIISLQ